MTTLDDCPLDDDVPLTLRRLKLDFDPSILRAVLDELHDVTRTTKNLQTESETQGDGTDDTEWVNEIVQKT